ncbi:uncharacterized protein I303_104605 [Kwoniella dejecticola CBS 10117]|uniref:Uncharacterized protein n=1 Tax=Kwoniella dejecticola CBS 10117 TaxID=1296121 RepID=A0A1A6A4V1_9TREE|nr:uncharacterized protein I303_04417 [Kwoniella dejecticola CBS 10117]OBR85086.1 hypothetical protein I303_04417 [Kwoniella dejecticola CBS 10117]
MPAEKIEKEPWAEEHTSALLQATINLVLAHRPELYATPELRGVSDNGGNRINQKLQQMLKKLCAAYPGAEGLVEAQIRSLKEAKANGSGGGQRSNPTTPKKRKMNEEEKAF